LPCAQPSPRYAHSWTGRVLLSKHPTSNRRADPLPLRTPSTPRLRPHKHHRPRISNLTNLPTPLLPIVRSPQQPWPLQEHSPSRCAIPRRDLITTRPQANFCLLCSVWSPAMEPLERYAHLPHQCAATADPISDVPPHILHHQCLPRRIHPHCVSQAHSVSPPR
jgi:hypothetical protein